MAKYRVTKVPVRDNETGERFVLGQEVELTVKRVAKFEKQHGAGYFERVEETKDGD